MCCCKRVIPSNHLPNLLKLQQEGRTVTIILQPTVLLVFSFIILGKYFNCFAMLVLWPPPNNFMATLLLRSLCIFWPEQNLSQSFSYIKNPFNTVTLLIELETCGPVMTGLIVFHCIR